MEQYYELISNLNDFDFPLENCLFGTVKFTKNADFDKYKYSGYVIGFDVRGAFLFPNGGFAQNVTIFEGDMSSSVHTYNKKKYILVLLEGLTSGLDDKTLTEEKKYSINFTVFRNTFWLSLHYNGDNSHLFFNVTEIIEFKAKDSDIIANPKCLGNIPEDFSVANMKKKRIIWIYLRF